VSFSRKCDEVLLSMDEPTATDGIPHPHVLGVDRAGSEAVFFP
jgi:hypothetical protein